MKRDNNGRFVKAVKVSEKKELVIGDKITSFDQLKEGMLVDFKVGDGLVKDAIIVNDQKVWYAVHDCEGFAGGKPSKEKMFGKKCGWALGGYIWGTDYKDMIFRGWSCRYAAEKADKNDRYVKQAKELEAEMEGLIEAANVFFGEYAAAQKIKEAEKKVEGLKASGLSEVDQNLVETLAYKMEDAFPYDGSESVFIPKESSIYRKLQDPVFLFRGLMSVGIVVNFGEKGARLVWHKNAKKETEVKAEVKEVKTEVKDFEYGQELKVGQLKEGMVIGFQIQDSRRRDINHTVHGGSVVVRDGRCLFACHDDEGGRGHCTLLKKGVGKKYSYQLTKPSGEAYACGNFIFLGWHKKEAQDVKTEVKTEVKEEVKPVAKVETKNPYKIGDFVKMEYDGLKGKVIGVWEEYVWLMSPSNSGKSPWYRNYHDVSPWVEPLKYKKGDLVLLKDSSAVWEILEVVGAEGYHVKNIAVNNGYAPTCIYTDKDILRKIGVAVKE